MTVETFLLETFRVTTSDGGVFKVKGRCEMDVLLSMQEKGYPFNNIEKIEYYIGEESWGGIPREFLNYSIARLKEFCKEEQHS